MEKFGTPPAPVDEDVRDKVLSSPHGRRFAGWERPQPSMDELREQYGGSRVSDEELLLRYMVPPEDVQAARAAGPVRRSYELRDTTTVRELVDHALALRRPRHIRVARPDVDLTLRRTA